MFNGTSAKFLCRFPGSLKDGVTCLLPVTATATTNSKISARSTHACLTHA